MIAIANLVLNIVVMALLAATIYYAWKLSKNLAAFRQTRREFDGVMKELSRNIDEAYKAVEQLKRASRDAAFAAPPPPAPPSKAKIKPAPNPFQKTAYEAARQLIDSNNRKKTPPAQAPETMPSFLAEKSPADEPAFSILDRYAEETETSMFEELEDGSSSFQSQAERDLYSALLKTGKSPGRI